MKTRIRNRAQFADEVKQVLPAQFLIAVRRLGFDSFRPENVPTDTATISASVKFSDLNRDLETVKLSIVSDLAAVLKSYLMSADRKRFSFRSSWEVQANYAYNGYVLTAACRISVEP